MKVNIDLFPRISDQLNVRSIPAVFLVHSGNIIDTFTGIPSDEKLEDFINTCLLLDAMGKDKTVIEQMIITAQ